MDNTDDDGCRRFMVNLIRKHTSTTMSTETHVPVIVLDDDDLKIDKDYKLFMDRLRDDNPTKNRVSQQGKSKIIGFESEISRADRLVTKTRERIQRDNRLAQRRKRKIGELVRNQDNIQRDNKATKVSVSKVETLREVPLVRAQESTQGGNKGRKVADSKAETLRKEATQRDNRIAERRKRKIGELVTNQETIQRDNKAMKVSVSKVEILRRAVPLVKAQESIQEDNKGRKIAYSKAETLRKEAIQRDNRIFERRKRKRIDETKATAETSRDVPLVRVNRAKERKAVDETSRSVPVTQSSKGVYVETSKKNEEESVAVADKDYMSYLTWLVDSLKDSRTEPMENAQNDPPDIDLAVLDTEKESTIVPEKDLLVKVKDEPDSWSDDDDDDIIAVSDSPFSDGEDTPFVVSKSKNVVDVDKESTEDESSGNYWFKKLMDVLEKPYDEEELSKLSGRVSMKKPVIRCRELRKGRERSYKSDDLGQSYLESFTDFDHEYQLVNGDNKARLELLRGFFFYLENISQEGAFQPWSPENKKKLRMKKQCLQP